MPKKISVSDDAPVGCAIAAFVLSLSLSIAWIGFVVWVIYTLVTWLVSK